MTLSTDLLIAAYAQGAFPMADPESGELEWYSPDPRAILPLDNLHVSRSLARTIRADRFEVTTDTRFEQVVARCGEPAPGRETTWLDHRIARVCLDMHRRGLAHSVEAHLDGQLVGGLYGIRLGGAFFGESMFSDAHLGGSDASKVCLAFLVAHLRNRGACLLDTQFTTDHLTGLGVIEMPRTEFLSRLPHATAIGVEWTRWPESGSIVLDILNETDTP